MHSTDIAVAPAGQHSEERDYAINTRWHNHRHVDRVGYTAVVPSLPKSYLGDLSPRQRDIELFVEAFRGLLDTSSLAVAWSHGRWNRLRLLFLAVGFADCL